MVNSNAALVNIMTQTTELVVALMTINIGFIRMIMLG